MYLLRFEASFLVLLQLTVWTKDVGDAGGGGEDRTPFGRIFAAAAGLMATLKGYPECDEDANDSR